jgi:ketose-bisphosphate aldolase
MQSMRDMLAAAKRGGYALGYFEAWDQYSLEATLEAAEESKAPIILGFGGELMNQDWYNGGGQHRLAAIGAAAAKDAKVPVCLLLNEVSEFAQIKRGLTYGFNAVMLDTSDLPFEENIAATRHVVDAARAYGASVEGELGRLPDASGALAAEGEASTTDPAMAARYVAETGIDALSVSIGNVHILTEGEASIDFDLLAKLRDAVGIPMVVHGGTGFPEGAIQRAIEMGVAKFNVGTILKVLFLEGVREAMPAAGGKVDIQQVVGSRNAPDIMQRGKARMKAEVIRRLKLYGCAGKA